MDERDVLFANVLNDPADDTARLVLADWLEEHGEEPFGRFVRAGVVAGRFRNEELIDDPDYYTALDTVSKVVTSGFPARWLSALGIGPSPLAESDWIWDNAGDRVTVRIGANAGVYTRGFLSELIVPLEGWYEFATRALVAWPLERATITDVHGLSFWIDAPDPDRAGWRLTAAFTVQPRRHTGGLLNWFGAVFGSSDPPPRPVPVSRWSAERTFPDRATLLRMARDVWPVLFDEVRDAAEAHGVPVLRR